MTVVRRKSDATYQDVLDLPAGLTGQVIDGELFAHARPASPHAWVASRLGGMLGTPFDRGLGGPGGWHIVDEPELHLGPRPDILVPDLAGWRRARMPRRPSTPFLTLAPDWVCEVSSPSTVGLDRVRKMPIYAREGVGHVWIVDPEAHTIEVFRLEAGRWLFARAVLDEPEAALEPFEAEPLDLAYLWSECGCASEVGPVYVRELDRPHRPAKDLTSVNKPKESPIMTVAAVVAHHKELIRWNMAVGDRIAWHTWA